VTNPTNSSTDVDLRALLPPVRDQGQRGTCVAFAVTAAHEVSRAVGAVVSEDLSEEALFWGCKVIDGNWSNGTRFSSAATAISATGQPIEAVWPYVPGRTPGRHYDPPSQPDANWNKEDLGQASISIAAVRAELDAGRPVVLGLSVFDELFRPSAKGRIAVPSSNRPRRGRHAVLAVGHDATALLIRNSWGTTWGLGGYAWLSNGYAEHHVHEAWVIGPVARGAAPPSGPRTAGGVYGSQ
jgi:C1A family cysteine protease